MRNSIDFFDAGLVSYREMWKLQRELQKQLVDQKLYVRDHPEAQKKIDDSLIFVEHPHVYTLGKSGDAANLLKGLAELKQIDAEFIENDRGGDITYHGPGQIVGYPILDLDRHFTDVHKYLRYLEEVVIRSCADFGIKAARIEGLTGVWVNEQKICAMGIRCSRWVTMHGFALNVTTNLEYFNHIIPCGIRDKSVTSLSEQLGKPVASEEVKSRVAAHFADLFGVSLSDKKALNALKEKAVLKNAGE
ncbi:MAG: lipoyl(octanoyl) transferase LipB [Balneolaceae bacterium]